MRIIARRTLRAFVDRLEGHGDQRAVKAALDAWFAEASKAEWADSTEIRNSYAAANIVRADRVVLNIKGNDYRLIVAIDYSKAIVWIKWVGSHAAYDRIDAREIEHDH